MLLSLDPLKSGRLDKRNSGNNGPLVPRSTIAGGFQEVTGLLLSHGGFHTIEEQISPGNSLLERRVYEASSEGSAPFFNGS